MLYPIAVGDPNALEVLAAVLMVFRSEHRAEVRNQRELERDIRDSSQRAVRDSMGD